MILIDAGPLVALANPEDQYHEQCVNGLRELPLPYVSTWAVLAEAAWLVVRPVEFIRSVANSCADSSLQIRDLEPASLDWIAAFMNRYRNIGAQLADATLMYLAEREGIDTVFTLDRRDFSIYRTSKNRALKIVPE
ncbi:MAG: twitching motility protein PilT [Acidobacteria bacterium]|nr:MAG: twitching motility protein PilT [Acidobacteriota bacterium]